MDATGARAGAFRGFTIGHERENVDYDDAAVNLGTMISNATLHTDHAFGSVDYYLRRFRRIRHPKLPLVIVIVVAVVIIIINHPSLRDKSLDREKSRSVAARRAARDSKELSAERHETTQARSSRSRETDGE